MFWKVLFNNLQHWLYCCMFKRNRLFILWTAYIPHCLFRQGLTFMALTLSTIQKVSLSIQPVDAKGHPAPVDGIPTWTVVNESIASIVVSDDGMSAVLSATAPGQTQVGVHADARLGPDVLTIDGLLDVTVLPAEATTLEITAGLPELQ